MSGISGRSSTSRSNQHPEPRCTFRLATKYTDLVLGQGDSRSKNLPCPNAQLLPSARELGSTGWLDFLDEFLVAHRSRHLDCADREKELIESDYLHRGQGGRIAAARVGLGDCFFLRRFLRLHIGHEFVDAYGLP